MEKTGNHIETLGILTKEEILKTIEHNIEQNSLVVESLEPFPGYHGENLPVEAKPGFIYLVTNKKYTTETVFRATKKIKRYVNFEFDAIPGEIVIYSDTYYCIRLKNLISFDQISELQYWYFDEGIRFTKKKRINARGLISLKKTFILEKIDNDIFKDMEDKHMYYLLIPTNIKWSLFKKISSIVKNNLDNSNFDAARAYIYFNEITDFVRIYARNPSIERLIDIKEKYISEIKKYM